ncbi:hypothetical protein AgCh_037529 [Apium graveolens]
MEKIMSYSLKLEEWGGGLIREMKVQIGKYRKEIQRYDLGKIHLESKKLFSSVKDSMRLSPRIKFPVISDIQKEILVRPVADEEVKAAGFAMHSDKSPVMANRLTPTLNVIISEKQSAFIEGRLLTHNVLIAYERFEFPTLWVDRVMNCVKSVSYSFLRDGDVFGEIIPQRGVRQGDPISPFMYIICAEGLSGMIRVHEECGLLYGRKIANKAPSISHLLFAYDCYFFLKAKKSEAITLKSALQRYEVLSGQIINYEKSEVVFSPNTNEEDRMEVCESLGVRQVQKPGKYLGMPMNVGSSKTEVFGFLVNRVQQRLKECPNTTPHVQCPSSTDDIRPNLSAFDINSTDEEIGATSSVRPMGVKKAKGKRKHDEGISKIIEQNNVLVELIKKKNQDSERKLSLTEYKEENKILLKDLNSIFDPNLREFFRTEQTQIMEKRAQQQRSTSQARGSEDEGQGSQNDHNYNQYYDYLGGSRNNLFD